MDLDRRDYDGACHCGAVRFHVRLSDGLRTARRCNCSICRMRGGVAVTARIEDLQVLQGEEILGTYRFNTGVAAHHFCTRCGIYTHHQRRSNPGEFGVSVACLEGVSPFDFEELPVTDGASNHPSDGPAGGAPRLAGVLRFIRSD
ncbi:MAG: GFA family protein [Caulobacteraceae bacterium]